MATTKYLASNAFEIVKARCFLEGFENFRELSVKEFLNYDFTFIIPNESKAEAKAEGQEEADKVKEGEGAAEGAIKETGAATKGEVTPGEVASRDGNPMA